MRKKAALLATLLMASGPGFAGWTLVQESHEGIVYMDRDDAEKTANGWKVDSSQDFHKLQRDGHHEYLSAKTRYEVDCGAKKIRTLRTELYPENMAGGGALYANDKPGDWTVPGKASAVDLIVSSLCR